MAITGRATRLIDNPDLLRARLRAAPSGAGVYVMRDLAGRVAYVGKSALVQNRLRSYFTGVGSHPDRTRRLVHQVFDFEVIGCANSREALILENSLIKQHHPRYNVRLKDDKNYLYLKIPRPGAADHHAPGTAREKMRPVRGEAGQRATQFPRPYYTRRVQRDGARYFGPYTSAQSLRGTVKSLRAIFPFRTCSDEIFRRGQVCLDYHIKRCSGPCEQRIEPNAYAELLEQVDMFMDGRSSVLISALREQMGHLSKEMNFEQAARVRDRLRAIDRISERQSVLSGRRGDHDCVGIAIEAGRGLAAVLTVRRGKVIGMETHEIEGVLDQSPGECLSAFVAQYYSGAPLIPRTILVSEPLDDATDLSVLLAEERGRPVDVRRPQRGELRRLAEQARTTALTALRQKRIVEDFDSDRTEALLDDLAQQLGLTDPPRRIECYDISNTMGTNSVGSMVVFEQGRPKPGHYRHFGIKTVEGSNDFASMEETLRRRLTRYLRSAATGDDVPVDDPAGANGTARQVREVALGPGRRSGEESFATLPDLILIDGGKGQLGAARRVLVAAGLGDVAVFGLAKRNEELFRPDTAAPIILPRESPTLFLVQRVRDEAHRFAITHHRAKRGRTAVASKLDIIPGLGPARKRALLRRFGSVERVRDASLEELAEAVPRGVALRVKELL
ncbi:MAG: excinuclease ABC subunit UvrC [Candidatus Dormibacteria bacterium]